MERIKARKHAKELESLFSQIHRALQEQAFRKQWGLEITMPQFICLKILEAKNNCMMKDLAERLQLSLGTVTGIIDRLIKAGFVERYRDDRDRRVVRVKLTEEGKKVLQKVVRKREERLISILGQVDEDDFKVFVDSFKKLVVIMGQGTGWK